MSARFWRAALAAMVLALPGRAAFADDDPPDRVARLNYLSGSVSFRPASVDDWTAAEPNYPLTVGDHLWVDRDSRGEMHVGATAIRLAANTAVSFLNLDDRAVQLRLSDGALNLRVRELDEDESVEIDTPNASVTLQRPGSYRIEVDGGRALTTVTVRDGDADVSSDGSSFRVREGESAAIDGEEDPTYDVREAAERDEWDDWCDGRDRREDRVASTRYVSRGLIGYEDLDEYGTWRETREYGHVWCPSRVDREWAPYRNGHWAWVAPWGWTWVDDSPWGFAPFHYGRWAYYDGAWVWAPGTVVARPIYAPALVAFVGGDSLSLSVSSGGVGWFPLGPGEVYVPPYTTSRLYIQHVNITHVTYIDYGNVNPRYVNRTAFGFTAVPRNVFVEARPCRAARVVVEPRAFAAVRVVERPVGVEPVRLSVIGGVRAGVVVRRPPVVIERRTVVARLAPRTPVAPAWHGAPVHDQAAEIRAIVRTAPVRASGPGLHPVREGITRTVPVAPDPRVRRRDDDGDRGTAARDAERAREQERARERAEQNQDRPRQLRDDAQRQRDEQARRDADRERADRDRDRTDHDRSLRDEARRRAEEQQRQQDQDRAREREQSDQEQKRQIRDEQRKRSEDQDRDRARAQQQDQDRERSVIERQRQQQEQQDRAKAQDQERDRARQRDTDRPKDNDRQKDKEKEKEKPQPRPKPTPTPNDKQH